MNGACATSPATLRENVPAGSCRKPWELRVRLRSTRKQSEGGRLAASSDRTTLAIIPFSVREQSIPAKAICLIFRFALSTNFFLTLPGNQMSTNAHSKSGVHAAATDSAAGPRAALPVQSLRVPPVPFQHCEFSQLEFPSPPILPIAYTSVVGNAKSIDC